MDTGPDTPGDAARRARVPELDGIRGAAILLVIVWHYVHLHASPAPGTLWAKVNILFRATWTGVDLFFVLSGFLIGGILMAQRDSPAYYRAFYLRRFCRILPLYAVFLLVCAALRPEPVREALPTVGWMFVPDFPLLSHATFTQNLAMAWLGRFANQALNITWSLAVEEQFYLLLPFLIRAVPPRRIPALAGALIGGGVLLRCALYAAAPERAGFWCYVLLPCRWDPMFLGVLAAWALRQEVWRARLARAGGLLKGLWLALAALLAVACLKAWIVIMAPPVTLAGYTLLGLFYALTLVLVVAGHVPWAAAALRHPLLARLGVISYGVYLLHETVNGALHGLLRGARPDFTTAPAMLVTGLSLAVTLALAELSWRWFEGRWVAWGQERFPYRR
jgi:peptidoglycan/LPS O-acetylase OafA/YrhL